MREGGSRVAVVGYYGHQNTGDDALAATVVGGISKRVPTAEFYVASSPLVMPPGVKVRWRREIRVKIRGVPRVLDQWEKMHCGKLVLGGGSVIHDLFGGDRLRARLREFELLKALGQSLGAMGIALGPLTTEAGRNTARKILQLFDFVAVRDQLSVELAEEIGAPRPVLAFDPAVLLESTPLPDIGGDSYIDGALEFPVLGISVCNFSQYVGRGPEADKRRLGKLVDALRRVRWGDHHLWLFEFNGNQTVGDRPLAEQLLSALGDRVPCDIVPYHPNPWVTLQRIKRCDGMLAMRLHAAIFAYLARIPFVVLSYHQKCLGFAGIAGVPPELVLDSEAFVPNELTPLVDQLIRDELPRGPALPVEEAQDLAERNFLWFGEGQQGD